MKPWADRSAGERAGVVVGLAAAVIALLFAAWKVGPGSAPPATDVATDTGTEAQPETAEPAAEATDTEAEGQADTGDATAADATATDAAPADGTDATAADAAGSDTATDTADAPATEAAEPVAEATDAEPAAEEAAAAEATAEDATAEQAEATAEGATDAAAAPAANLPSFDLVRVTPDGSAVFAGSGAPDSTILFDLDGVEIGTVPADAQGNFVALFNLAPSEAPRVLTLAMRLPDGTEIAAPGRVVIAPTVAPAVADAAEAADDSAPEDVAAQDAPAQAPAALLVTDEGARVLQSGQELSPAMAANVTVDAITYTPEGDVQFAGRGTGGAIVRIYLDNRQIADSVVDGQGAWVLAMPGIDPGVYTLRVDQLDAEGTVTSRFETPFKRETMEALAAAAEAEQAAADAAATDTASDEAVAQDAPSAPDQPVSITVQPGFTLWRIARENLGDGVMYVQVFEANKDQIRNPDLIYPGQVFTIPQGD